MGNFNCTSRTDPRNSNTVFLIHFVNETEAGFFKYLNPESTQEFLHFSRFYQKVKTVAEKAEEKNKSEPILLLTGCSFFDSHCDRLFREEANLTGKLCRALKVRIACFTRRDLSLGLDRLRELTHELGVVSICTNVFDMVTRKPIAQAREYYVLPYDGMILGFISLMEEEDFVDMEKIHPSDICLIDYFDACTKTVKKLKNRHQCDIVVVLTSISEKKVKNLVRSGKVDLILVSSSSEAPNYWRRGTTLLHTQTGFREFNTITFLAQASGKVSLMETKTFVEMTKEDGKVSNACLELKEKFTRFLNKELIEVGEDIDSSIPPQNAFGFFLADLVRDTTEADIVILNSSVVEGHLKLKKNEIFTRGQLLSLIRRDYQVLVLQIKGSSLLKLLQNIFFRCDNFPFISGFNMSLSLGASYYSFRKQEIRIASKRLRPQSMYSLGCTDFMFSGQNIYGILDSCRVITSPRPLFDLVEMFLIQQSKSSENVNSVSLHFNRVDSKLKLCPILDDRLKIVDTFSTSYPSQLA